jgi:hypothetical protein
MGVYRQREPGERIITFTGHREQPVRSVMLPLSSLRLFHRPVTATCIVRAVVVRQIASTGTATVLSIVPDVGLSLATRTMRARCLVFDIFPS